MSPEDDAQKLTLTTINRDDVSLIQLLKNQALTDHTISMIGKEIFRLVDALGRRQLILNLSKIEFLASASLSRLITLHRKLMSVQGKLVIVEPHKEIMDVFRLTKLDRLLTFVKTEEEAYAAIGGSFILADIVPQTPSDLKKAE